MLDPLSLSQEELRISAGDITWLLIYNILFLPFGPQIAGYKAQQKILSLSSNRFGHLRRATMSTAL